jgi:predicted transcriptional regulator of viral defense system
MRLLKALQQLQQLNQTVISTKDAAACLAIKPPHASKILTRLQESNQLVHLGRGIWSTKMTISPFLIPESLAAPFPAYISLQSALYHHDMISQIPSVVYAVSLARTHCFQTPIATVSIHHIGPDFFTGFDLDCKTGIKMATAEKALLDCIYLGCIGRGSLFKSLPELEFPSTFSLSRAKLLIEKIKSIRLRSMISARLEGIYKI